MKDEVFGEFEECPKCHSDKGLYYCFQVPFYYEQKLNGTYCNLSEGKLRKLTQKALLQKAKFALKDEYQMAQCCCNLCGWYSEPISPYRSYR